MDVFRIRKTREIGGSSSSMGTLDSVHQDQVQNLRSSETKQEELKTKLEALREQRETLSMSIELTEIVKCSQIDLQIREIEEELSKANPVEEYYMKNMDILLDYYGKETEVLLPLLLWLPLKRPILSSNSLSQIRQLWMQG
jgi:septal ring factor EnvC (AmiA/AmiB activator)